MVDYSKPFGECPFSECLVSGLEDQLAQQAALLRRALGVVEWVSEIDFPYGPDAINAKAQALAPDLRKALEEKPWTKE